MDPTREEIVRDDFPRAVRGYDPGAVEAHLRRVSEAVERLQASRSRTPLAESAGEKIAGILEVAERQATEIEAEAREQAEGILAEAKEKAREQVERAQEAVNRLVRQADELRTAVGTLGQDLAREATAERERPAPEIDPTPVTVPEPAPPREPEPEPPLTPEPEPPLTPEPGPAEVPEPRPEPFEPGGTRRSNADELIAQLEGGDGNDTADTAAARLVAMNMALDGSSRKEIERHLAQSYDLADREALLDEVFTRIAK
jgi:DivIVA domain-containing protein